MNRLLATAVITVLTGAASLGGRRAVAQNNGTAATPHPSPPALANPNANNPGAPAAGANSFTEAQAKSRIEAAGYSNVSGLTKDKDGIWRVTASKASTTVGSTTLGSTTVDVALDYQGNVVAK